MAIRQERALSWQPSAVSSHAPGRTAETTPFVGAMHVWVLYTASFAQPLLGVLAESPQFFVAHHAAPSEIALAVFALCFALPAPLLLALLACRLISGRLWWFAHLTALACFSALYVLVISKHATELPWPPLSIVAVAAGAGAALWYRRSRLVRSTLSLLSIAILLVPGFFLLFSPASNLVLAKGFAEQVQVEVEVETDIPVVLAVFDELPLVALLDEDLEIDSARYPNIAAFAARSTWYRNTTTVALATMNAVPAILTGLRPDPELKRNTIPRAEDHPRSLFTLLGGSSGALVFESITGLCPEKFPGCDLARRSPGQRLRSMAADLRILQMHVLFPEDLTADLPDVTQRWRDFGTASSGDESAVPSQGAPTEFQHARWQELANVGRREHFQRFLREIETAPGPLYFVHSVLPHKPWEYLPSGRRYHGSGALKGFLNGRWSSEPHAIQAQQRHLLQLAFVDRLVGRLIARLEEVELFDQALVIVTSDHGASFRDEDWNRELSDHNHADVLPVPLFVKRPLQERGGIDDRNVETVDILPTIADVLGIHVPWALDGQSVFDDVRPERSEKRVFSRDVAARSFGVRVYPARLGGIPEAVALHTARFGSRLPAADFFAVGPFRVLLGVELATLSVTPAPAHTLELENRTALARLDPDAAVLPMLAGKVAPPAIGDIAIAVNGTIRSVTRLDGEGEFATALPASSFSKGGNDVDILLITGSPESPALLRVAAAEDTSRSR